MNNPRLAWGLPAQRGQWIRRLIGLGLACLLSFSVQAQLFSGSDTGERLLSVDPDALTVTEIADMLDPDLDALAADQQRQVLYGFGENGQLFTLDTETGVSELIGIVDYEARRDGMAYDPTRGVLFLTGSMNGGELLRVDPDTAEYTVVGSFGDDIGVMWGLAYDPNTDNLYGTDARPGTGETATYRINPDTGAATLLGIFGSESERMPVDSLTFDPTSNTLYGFADPGSSGNFLVEISTQSGLPVASNLTDPETDSRSLAWLDAPAVSIPVNSTMAQGLMALLLVLLAMRYLRPAFSARGSS